MGARAVPVMCDQQRSKHSLLPLPVKSGEREPRGVRCIVMGTHER